MIGNTNIPSSKSSKEIKILNVVQTGNLTQDGSIFSDFNSGNNYIQPIARVDKGILNLDNSTNTKNFGFAASLANNWEVVVQFVYKRETSRKQGLFCNNVDYSTHLSIRNDEKVEFQVSNSTNSADIGLIISPTVLTDGQEYYAKGEFTGSTYNLYLSTDGTNWNLEGTSITSQTKITNRGNGWMFGWESTARYQAGSMDMAKCYIKINGEYWWKGVETL